ncbi:MAG TPA: hypothetical protein VF642_05985 [Propionibacteriaceae bacterium]
MTEPTPLACGAPFRLPAVTGVSVTGRFPTTVDRSEVVLSGTVSLVSTDSDRTVVTSPEADVFLVRDGVVVTEPLVQDSMGSQASLALGEELSLPATGALVPCASDDPGGPPLAPGPYELYARVLLSNDDGTAQECFGGPWLVELR